MIDFDNVHKKFDGRIVLDGISFTIKEGETFVIIGMSGTGKTVTLRHMAGFIDPDMGLVTIDGVKMNEAEDTVKEKLRRRMGMVFQSGALINWMTVYDNISLPLVERGELSVQEIHNKVDEIMQLLYLGEAKGKMPAEISGGMKKRACLARVLVRHPDIILYDEPTSGLDPVMSSVISNMIVDMQKDFGHTSVVVTHDMNSAYTIADRIAVLYNGRIIQLDEPINIKNSSHPIVQQFVNGSVDGPIDVD